MMMKGGILMFAAAIISSLFSSSVLSENVSGTLSDANFAAVFMGGNSGLSSANFVSSQATLGESIAVPPDLSSNSVNVYVGVLKLYSLTSSEDLLPIKDLRAKTDTLGESIPEGTWCNDSSPYFYWKNVANPPENIIGYSFALDEAPADEINLHHNYYQYSDESISDGQHVFYVKPAGGGASWGNTLSFNIWVDTLAPEFGTIYPLGGAVISSPNIEIYCVFEDRHSGVNMARVSMSLNGESVPAEYETQSKKLVYEVKGLKEGEITVLAEAEDTAGNKSSKSWAFIFDMSAPTGAILINSGDKLTNSPYVLLALSAEDTVSGVTKMYISNDGIFDAELSKPYSYSSQFKDWLLGEPDQDGEKTVYVIFEDKAGNKSAIYSASITLKLLTPNTRIISGPQRTTKETSAEFIFEGSVSNCLFSYKLDNGEWSAWSSDNKASFSSLSEGNHYFFVKAALDLNGNDAVSVDEEDPTPAEWLWTIGDDGGIEKKEDNLFWKLSFLRGI